MRTDRLKEEFGLAIHWRAFPLHPETPEEGRDLNDLFAGHVEIEAMLMRCRQVAKDLDLSFGERRRTYNSRRAQELGKWAEAQGAGEAFHKAVYLAYFAEGRNIAEVGVLAEITQAIGLDHQAVPGILSSGQYAAQVDKDWQAARVLGVTAVPTCIDRHRRMLVGFHPYPDYRQFVINSRRVHRDHQEP